MIFFYYFLFCDIKNNLIGCFFSSRFLLQLSDQIQNLTVSSTTSTSGPQQSTSSAKSSDKSEKQNSTAGNATATTSNNSNLNLSNSSKDSIVSDVNSANESLAQRVKFLQTKLAHAPMPSITSKRRQLPSIEEAWNLPISAEMSSRQQQTAQSNQQRAYAKNYNHVSTFIIIVIVLTNSNSNPNHLTHKESYREKRKSITSIPYQ